MFERTDIFHSPAQERISVAVLVRVEGREDIGTSGLSLVKQMNYLKHPFEVIKTDTFINLHVTGTLYMKENFNWYSYTKKGWYTILLGILEKVQPTFTQDSLENDKI